MGMRMRVLMVKVRMHLVFCAEVSKGHSCLELVSFAKSTGQFDIRDNIP